MSKIFDKRGSHMRARQAAVALFATVLLSPSATAADLTPTVPDASSRGHFQKCLMALYESDLVQVAPKDPKAETYRLVFLPSLSDQTSMRVIAWGDGTGRMIFHRLDHSDCEKSRDDVEEQVYALSRDEVARLKASIADYDFWTAPYREGGPGKEPVTCSDGVAAYFEGVTEGKYNLINRRCAWSRRFQNLVDVFHQLARSKEAYSTPILE